MIDTTLGSAIASSYVGERRTYSRTRVSVQPDEFATQTLPLAITTPRGCGPVRKVWATPSRPRVDAVHAVLVVFGDPEGRAGDRHPLRAGADDDRLQHLARGGVEPPKPVVEVARDPDRAAAGRDVVRVVTDLDLEQGLARSRVELVHDPVLARDPDPVRLDDKPLVQLIRQRAPEQELAGPGAQLGHPAVARVSDPDRAAGRVDGDRPGPDADSADTAVRGVEPHDRTVAAVVPDPDGMIGDDERAGPAADLEAAGDPGPPRIDARDGGRAIDGDPEVAARDGDAVRRRADTELRDRPGSRAR
jgi:hypothetical protein